MTYLNIKTPTVVDLRELFTLGLTSKRDGSKIGSKGSGLKFGLAQLHRLGSALHVWTPQGHWASAVRKDTVRGHEHEFVVLNGPEGEIPTHITTLAGADTWTEPWFCLRELMQNALDEGGSCQTTLDPSLNLEGDAYTVMQVELAGDLLTAWNEHGRWFHPRHPEIWYESPTTGFYYFGFLIYEQKDWPFAYDMTGILGRDKLSEDRQLRNADFEAIFERVLQQVGDLPEAFYDLLLEGNELPQDLACIAYQVYRNIGCSNPNSGGFKMDRLVTKFREAHGPKACWTQNRAPETAEWYYAKAAGFQPVYVSHRLASLLAYQDSIPKAQECLPALTQRLAAATELEDDAKGRLKRALKICGKLRPKDCKVLIVDPRFPEDKLKAGALAIRGENKVLVLKSFVERAELDALVRMLIEEFAHLESGEGDCSEGFEKFLIAKLAEFLMPKQRHVTEALVF